jgi:urocanate hydratase
MTTAQPKTQPIEAAYGHIKDFNEQMIDAARKAVTQYVDTYTKAVDRAIDVERKLADATKQEWLKSIIEAQADMNDAYASSVHSLLK